MRITYLTALALFLCVQVVHAQAPQLYVPYQYPAAPPQYVQQAPQPVQPAPPQPIPQQPPTMYDTSYAGPMNMYGQPVFSPGPSRQGTGEDSQTIHNGLVPLAGRGLYSLGTHLWSYMPAPVRGEASPYEVAPGAGQVSIMYVPAGPR